METGLGKQLDSPTLLKYHEICPRKAFLAAKWRRNKVTPVEALREVLYRILVAPAAPNEQGDTVGDMAGSEILDIASSPGLAGEFPDPFGAAMHYANLADLLATVLRKPTDKALLTPEPVGNWTSSALIVPAGTLLRRLVIVSHWTRERQYSECMTWETIGEMAVYNLPMQLIFLVIGQERNGKRHSHWTKALRHTIGKQNIRFRRRVGNTSGGFKDSWTEIWREDHEEISRETWLNGMLKDDVLNDLSFPVDMPALTPYQRQVYLDLIKRKMHTIEKTKVKPPLQLTGCHWPIPCEFERTCHDLPEREPSEKSGFVQIETRNQNLPADSCTVP